MTPTEVAAKLRRYTLWRRGGAIDQPDPREFGEAVDAAVEIIELMKVYETALREKITTKGLDVVADTDILEILDRLEAAEQTAQDYLRIDREKAQIAQRLEAAEKERDALRAKIAEMEKQEPVARFNWNKGKLEWLRPWNYSIMNMKPLYLAPGAQPPTKRDQNNPATGA